MSLAVAPRAAESAAWGLRIGHVPEPPLAAVAGEARLLDGVAQGSSHAIARIWQSDCCIAAPARLARLPGFVAAAQRSAEAGWPVVLRGSGGEPVPLDPGVVNLSLAYWVPMTRRWPTAAAYDHLSGVAARALWGLGFTVESGMVAGAFCPGCHDLSIAGRKIAGAAQQRRPASRGGVAGTAILAHLALLVAPDLAVALAALARFESLLGVEPNWSSERVTTLARERRGPGTELLGDVRDRLRANLIALPAI